MFHIRTAEELRERPPGWTFQQHYDAVKTALAEHNQAAREVAQKADDEQRELTPLEQKTADKHLAAMTGLELLLRRLDDSPEGKAVDYRQVVPTDGGYESQWRHTGGGHTYNAGEHRKSWIKDLVAASTGDQEARGRLVANNREFAVENRALAGNITGAAGEFVPPLWMMQQLVRVARAGRVFADQINGQPLTEKTNTIDIPRLATGTAVAKQATENSAVQNTDATSDSISSTVVTLAGQQVLSVQLIDQSPVSVDQIVLEDLAAALAVQVDQFALSSTGTGTVGVLNVSGINAVTYTDASPTVGELYPKVADAIQRINTLRFMPPTKVFMHPRRWAWLTAALDTAGRPLVVPVAQMPQNSVAAMSDVASEGFVGAMQGLPVFVDANVPTNLGTGTNEDRIIVARSNDLFLWQSVPFALIDPYSLSANMSVRLRLHSYVAVQHGRYPTAVSVISGTGLVAPTF